ncbi:MAG: alpha/beta hydrolase fold domain-containing protein [Pseudomonadota bacterium]
MGFRLRLLSAATSAFARSRLGGARELADLRRAARRIGRFVASPRDGGFHRQRLGPSAVDPQGCEQGLSDGGSASLAWFDEQKLDFGEARPAERAAGAVGVILFAHGGGYVSGAPETHRSMIAALARHSGLPLAALDHRLAPEHPFPAAFDDACAAFSALQSAGVAPSRIALAGDGAGGGLALSLGAALQREGRPPAAIAAFSPWTDLALTSRSLRKNARRDALFSLERRRMSAKAYLAGADPTDPRASPLYAAFEAPPPPTLLQIGSDDALKDDGLRMAERLRRAGGDVRLELFQGAPHGFQLFTPFVAEATQALRSAARFLRDAVEAATARAAAPV